MKRYLLLLIQLMLIMSCNNDDSSDHVISPVEVDTTTSEILSPIDSACYNTGRMVMQRSCRSCHLLFEDRTGPGLAGLEERKPDRRSLKDFIRNPGKTMFVDKYYFCQKEKFGSVMMPFIDFTDHQLDCLFDYIKAESLKNPGRRSGWHREAMANLKKSNGKSACP